jgi:hypothetical protein
MRALENSPVLSVALLVGAAIAANAEQYRPPQLSILPPPAAALASRAPHPSSWYYDPYTSHSTVCPEGGTAGGDICTRLISPSGPTR